MKRIYIQIAMALLLCSTANATTYCSHNGGAYLYVDDGFNIDVSWTMTVAKNRKILVPTETKPYEWCAVHWDSLGPLIKPIEVLSKPKLNEVGVYRMYRVAYHAAKLGDDSFTVRITWLNRSNKEQSAILNYKVKVVANDL